MFSQKLLCSLLIIGFAVSTWSASAVPPRNDDRGYVLLINGNVLHGTIKQDIERFSISVDGNSVVSLDAKQIAYIGPTLESLYQYHRGTIKQWGTGEHFQLAHWCLQQSLLEHAIEHYDELERSAPDSPRFKQLEQLLRQALWADEDVKQAIHLKAAVANTNPSNSKSEVIQAVSEVSRSVHPTQNDSKSQGAGTRASNDAWTKHEVPDYIRKSFQFSVLPVLVSRCGQAGCHGALGKSDFHIYQPVGEQAAVQLAKDLDQVLKYLDQDKYQNSPLLVYATKAHGIQKTPALNSSRADDRTLTELVSNWAKSLALSQKPGSTMPAQYPSTNQSGPAGTTAIANTPTSSSASLNPATIKPTTRRTFREEEVVQDRNAKLSKPAKSAQPTEVLSMSELSDLEAAIDRFEKQLADGGKGAAKKDPFDPNVFNRKYR
jgi:hypothetical protein